MQFERSTHPQLLTAMRSATNMNGYVRTLTATCEEKQTELTNRSSILNRKRKKGSVETYAHHELSVASHCGGLTELQREHK